MPAKLTLNPLGLKRLVERFQSNMHKTHKRLSVINFCVHVYIIECVCMCVCGFHFSRLTMRAEVFSLFRLLFCVGGREGGRERCMILFPCVRVSPKKVPLSGELNI